MIEILKSAMQRGASDLHLKAGDVVRARIHGELVPLTQERLKPEQTRDLAAKLLPHEKDRQRIDEITDYDCSWGAPGVGRFRVNILRQRGSFMIVLRTIPFEAPTFQQLELPDILGDIALANRGLILVTGVTGAGKTTTLAAMLNHINLQRRKHIITLEDPIEFLHRDNQSSITQRDVGTDTADFGVGLRAALREDPDVILVGEMRDPETIDIALKAAETGHLVFSTLHTQNAVKTISRVVSVFPPAQQEMARVRLSETVVAIISMRLVARKGGKGRIAAVEIMRGTPTVREFIREPDKLDQIDALIAEGRQQYGSQSLDQHLADLVSAGIVDFEVAKGAAASPSDFELKLRTFA